VSGGNLGAWANPTAVADFDRLVPLRQPADVLRDVKASLALAATPIAKGTPTPRPKVGSRAQLVMRASDYVPVADTFPDLLELSRAVRANDVYGIGELMGSGEVWLVPSPSEVLILTPDAGENNAFRVRFMSGPYKGQIAYTLIQYAQ